jgi:hypothetical protein
VDRALWTTLGAAGRVAGRVFFAAAGRATRFGAVRRAAFRAGLRLDALRVGFRAAVLRVAGRRAPDRARFFGRVLALARRLPDARVRAAGRRCCFARFLAAMARPPCLRLTRVP